MFPVRAAQEHGQMCLSQIQRVRELLRWSEISREPQLPNRQGGGGEGLAQNDLKRKGQGH